MRKGSLWLALVVALSSACVAAPSGTPASYDPNVMTREELVARPGASVFDAIMQRHPLWFQGRGQSVRVYIGMSGPTTANDMHAWLATGYALAEHVDANMTITTRAGYVVAGPAIILTPQIGTQPD